MRGGDRWECATPDAGAGSYACRVLTEPTTQDGSFQLAGQGGSHSFVIVKWCPPVT